LATDELILNLKTKQKNKKELEIWQENTRSPEEGKRRGNAQEESTDRWTQQEHQRIKPGGEYGPMDTTRTPEDETGSSTQTAG
jgi:hypothetical protein